MVLYVFIDESGDHTFASQNGASEWYLLTSLSTTNPEEGLTEYYRCRHQLLVSGHDDHYRFHATEDKHAVRDVFLPIVGSLQSARVDCLAIRKNRLNPSLYPLSKFYPWAMHYLLKYVFDERGMNASAYEHVVVCSDRACAPKKERQALKQGVKGTLSQLLGSTPYTQAFLPSESHPYLQFVDYCSWSLYVYRSRREKRPRKAISRIIRSDYDLFETSCSRFY